jgi:hypothetical protein
VSEGWAVEELREANWEIPSNAGELTQLMTMANACEFFHCLPEQVVAHDYALLVSVMNVAGAMRK